MITRLYKIYDMGPGHTVRYETCCYTFENCRETQAPHSWHEEKNYLTGVYDDLNVAETVANKLNDQHVKSNNT